MLALLALLVFDAPVDPAECDKRALEQLQAGGLDEEQAAALWRARGTCALDAGDAERAGRAFAAALRIDPEIPAVDHEAFARARAEVLPASLAFTAVADADAIAIALVGDDLQLTRSAAIVGPEGERARVPLAVGHGAHRVSGVDHADAWVALLDRWGNIIRRAPIDRGAGGSPAITAGDAPVGPVTYAGAALLVTGMAGMTAASVAIALSGENVLEDAPLFVAGLGAGAAVFLVGAGLVVLDQGL